MIRVDTREKYFKIFYKEKCFIDHNTSKPAFFIGNGNGSYKDRHAMYKIKSLNEKLIPLKTFKFISNNSKRIVISLEDQIKIIFEDIDNMLKISFEDYKKDLNRFKMKIVASAEEAIYGCGEQYSELNLKGKTVPLWVQEQGIGRGKDLITFLADLTHGAGGNAYTTYFPQPTFVSSDNYFCHCNFSAYSKFKFKKNQTEIMCWQIPDSIIIGKEDSALKILSKLSEMLGRQVKLPEWVYDGVWLGVQGGKKEAELKMQKAADAGVKIGALWAQDWEGIRITSFGKQLMWDWKYDKNLYENLPEYIKELNKKNIKFLGYINPFLAIGTTDDENDPIPENFFYKEASEKGYCAKEADGEKDFYETVTTFPAAMVDLTNPEAYNWIKDIIKKEMIGIGLSGWMCDFSESFPVHSKIYSEESPEIVHNKYPVLWAKVNYEALKETGKLGEAVFFMRAGYTGSSKYSTAHWAGDQMVNWSMDDGLATVIPAGISLGFSGVSNHHSDIGGYTSVAWIKRSKELFMRWAEQAAFTTVMRTHECNRPDTNHQFYSDDETLKHFAKMSRIFTALKEYHLHTADEYQNNGIPAMRHPYIHYESDKYLHDYKYQYMYGRDLLVAPVYKKGKRTVSVHLPSDSWIHLWTGKKYYAGKHKIKAPIGQPAVFYREKSEFIELFKGLKNV